MTLASQNIRSDSRHRHMMTSRRFVSPKLLGGLVAVGAISLTAWWLLRADDRVDAPGSDGGSLVDESVRETDALVRRDDDTLRMPPSSAPAGARTGAGGSSGTVRGVDDPNAAIVMGGRVGGGAAEAPAAPALPSQAPSEQPTLTPPVTPAVASADSSTPGAAQDTGTKNASTGDATAPTAPPSAAPSTPPGSGASTAPGTGGTTPPPSVPFGATTSVELAQALQLQSTDPLRSRLLATRALDGRTLSRSERERAYDLVNALATTTFLNANVNPNDPTMAVYSVQAGDSLQKIVRTQGLDCDYRLLQRINALSDPNKLRLNQRLRVPKGTFHAEVIKDEYRLNLYLGEGSDRVMVRSLRVGLGESNGTPLGLFKVRPASKLVDPQWTHPRTGQHFAANDPKNPIGEHWIGLIGVEDRNREFLGYGIHGTIEPESIGQDKSLGCVRMLADDVALVYECLTEPDSTILIR